MQIVTLTENRFNDFSKSYDKKNYKQTVEYANCMQLYGYKKLYLGLIDNEDNVIAAALILEKKANIKYKTGYVPTGFLINYDDKVLLDTFSNLLKDYLNKLNYIYIRLNPYFPYKLLNKKNLVLKYNPSITDSLKRLGYIQLDYNTTLDNREAIIEIKENVSDIYNSFSRSLKRKIQESNLMGINYYQENDLETFYRLVEKKKTKELKYYEGMQRFFKNEDCKFNIYFAKLNTEIYLNNYRYILKKEQEKNYRLQEKISNLNIKKTDKLVNSKITSDKLLNKYKTKVIEASELFSKYPDGLVIGACALIEYDDTIYFIEEGYEDSLRNIYSLSMLKWEIIKKYNNLGYKIFNLGILPIKSENNKYQGLYQSKIVFNPTIYEYSGEFDFVVNKYLYKLHNKIVKNK